MPNVKDWVLTRMGKKYWADAIPALVTRVSVGLEEKDATVDLVAPNRLALMHGFGGKGYLEMPAVKLQNVRPYEGDPASLRLALLKAIRDSRFHAKSTKAPADMEEDEDEEEEEKQEQEQEQGQMQEQEQQPQQPQPQPEVPPQTASPSSEPPSHQPLLEPQVQVQAEAEEEEKEEEKKEEEKEVQEEEQAPVTATATTTTTTPTATTAAVAESPAPSTPKRKAAVEELNEASTSSSDIPVPMDTSGIEAPKTPQASGVPGSPVSKMMTAQELTTPQTSRVLARNESDEKAIAQPVEIQAAQPMDKKRFREFMKCVSGCFRKAAGEGLTREELFMAVCKEGFSSMDMELGVKRLEDQDKLFCSGDLVMSLV